MSTLMGMYRVRLSMCIGWIVDNLVISSEWFLIVDPFAFLFMLFQMRCLTLKFSPMRK